MFVPALILSAGLAIQSVRFLRDARRRVPSAGARSVGWLVAVFIATTVFMVGGRIWSEIEQVSSLPPPPAGARNVLLIVWDTVRAANTSAYGYHRATTPNLDRLAGRGVRFDLAFSAASWTLPSHASMFTGRWPHELHVDWKAPMRDDVPTLAGSLASRGYDTAGFVANFDYFAGKRAWLAGSLTTRITRSAFSTS